MIYLDSAATSLHRPRKVGEAVLYAMEHFGNSSRGSHEAALAGARCVYEARLMLSELFHAEGPEQIAFTMNATESLNIAIKGILGKEDRAVTTVLEHNSVLRPLYELNREGMELSIVGCDDKGRLLYGELEQELKKGAKALVVTQVSNLTGNRTDLERIGRMCRENGTLLVVDAAQGAGHFSIDMERMQIDVLCFTGHKCLLGPQGTGGLAVRKGVAIQPLLSGGSGIKTFQKEQPAEMPERLEAGTLNAHGIAGLLAGIRYLKREGMEKLARQSASLCQNFYQRVKEIPGIVFYGDMEAERAPILSLNVKGWDSARLADMLSYEYGICVRAGGHCAPLLHEALGTDEQGAVRFSFSHFNTIEEVGKAADALKELANVDFQIHCDYTVTEKKQLEETENDTRSRSHQREIHRRIPASAPEA